MSHPIRSLSPVATVSTAPTATSQACLTLFFIEAQSLDAGPTADASFTLACNGAPAVRAESLLSRGDGPGLERSQAFWSAGACADALCAEADQSGPDGAGVQASARVRPGPGGVSLQALASAAGSGTGGRGNQAQAQATPSPLGLRVVLSPRSVLTVHARAQVSAQVMSPARLRDERALASAELYIACDRDGGVARSAVALIEARASSGGCWTDTGWAGPNPRAAEARTLEARFANPGDTALSLWIVTGVAAEARSASCGLGQAEAQAPQQHLMAA